MVTTAKWSAPKQLRFYPRLQIHLRSITERNLSYAVRMDSKRPAKGLFVYIGQMKFVWQVIPFVWTEKQEALPRSVGDSRWVSYAYTVCGRHRAALSVCASLLSNPKIGDGANWPLKSIFILSMIPRAQNSQFLWPMTACFLSWDILEVYLRMQSSTIWGLFNIFLFIYFHSLQIFIKHLLWDGQCRGTGVTTDDKKVVSANKKVFSGKNGQISFNSNKAEEWCLYNTIAVVLNGNDFAPKGYLAMSGDIFACYTLGGGRYRYLVGRGQRCC